MPSAEVWLRTNRRAVAISLATCMLPIALGAALLWLGVGMRSWWQMAGGAALLAAGGLYAMLLAIEFTSPRLAYESGHLVARLLPGRPYRVPIEIVECFLLGQGLSLLPGKRNQDRRTITISIRLAERAADWRQRPTLPALGGWCGGQITIRGTWCEPITLDLVQRLNARLAEVQRACRPPQVVR
jgi:hypothetical protein